MNDYKIVKSGSGTPEDAGKCEVLIKKGTSAELQNILNSLPTWIAPGSVAYTADFSTLKMKDLDGTWAEIGG